MVCFVLKMFIEAAFCVGVCDVIEAVPFFLGGPFF